MSRRSEPLVCGSCGRVGPLHKRATAQQPALCKRCYRRHQPQRPCDICGKTRPIRIRARDGQPDVCGSCVPIRLAPCGACGRVGRIAVKATEASPALGRCCWTPPTAICSACGRERPCHHANGPKPLCLICRGRRLAQCLDCGCERPAHRRVSGGLLCAACDRRRGNTTGICRGCRGPAPLKRDLCDACRLRERISELQATGDPHAVQRLAPYLTTLADAPNPASTLRWLQSPTLALVEDLLAGRVGVSHAALDVAQGDENDGRAVGHVRAALVQSGVLEPRDEPSASFARWQQRAIEAIAPGPDRGHVRAYASWHVAHELARTTARDRATPATQKYARSLVTEAIKLVDWLHNQELELRHLRQDLIDTWIAAGTTTRRRVRLFLRWLVRAGVTGQLHVAWNTPHAGHGPLRRTATVRRRPPPTARPRHRPARPLRRTAASALRPTADAHHDAENHRLTVTSDGEITVTLARGAVPLPEPLGSLAHALRDQRLAATDAEGWLLPGRKAGTHITAERLRERLQRYEITSRRAATPRCSPLPRDCRRPSSPSASASIRRAPRKWVRAAGATYSDYVALRIAP